MKENYSLIFVAVIWDVGMHLGANCNPFWRPGSLGSVQFSCSVVSDCLQPHGVQHARLPCLSPPARVYWNSCPLNQWCIKPFHPLPSLSPPAFNLSQHQRLFKWVSSSHQVAKVLDFQLQHQSFHWTPRTISFRMNWISLQSKGLSRVFSNTTVQKHQKIWAI